MESSRGPNLPPRTGSVGVAGLFGIFPGPPRVTNLFHHLLTQTINCFWRSIQSSMSPLLSQPAALKTPHLHPPPIPPTLQLLMAQTLLQSKEAWGLGVGPGNIAVAFPSG